MNEHIEDRRKARRYKWTVVTQSLKTGNITISVFDNKKDADVYNEYQKPDTQQWVKRATYHKEEMEES